MIIKSFDSKHSMMSYFGLSIPGIILQTDLKECHNETEENERQYHDAEVLTTIAKNVAGNCLEIGTSTGHGTYKIATNTNGVVFTLNALPSQIRGSSITHAITKEQIGSFTRSMGVVNFKQFYEDSMIWEIPDEVSNLAMIFVDGCHDTNYVYSDSKKTICRLKPEGFIVWHDFHPDLRRKFFWINEAMRGVERFCSEFGIEEVYHLKDSWMGFWKKS